MCPKGTQQTGYWRLTVDERVDIVDDKNEEQPTSEAVELWDSLCKITEEAPHLFCKPPDQSRGDSSSTRYCGYIYFYTPDHRDKHSIRLAAEFIRSRVRHPFVMHYFKLLKSKAHDLLPPNCSFVSPALMHQGELLFEHTPEGELYEKKENSMKLVVAPNTSPSSNVILPSKVFDKEYIFWPSTQEGRDKMRSYKGGKWIVFSSYDDILKLHDSAWLALLPLCKIGILVGLKASTNVPKKKRNPEIYCYTADTEDEADILKAAVTIRIALKNEHIMYYKPNYNYRPSPNYSRGVVKSVRKSSKYMYTVQGGFYKKDDIGRFEFISTSEDNDEL